MALRKKDLLERTFNFAVDCLKLTRHFPNTTEYKVIRFQICKSATSVGANYEESQAASSKKDFVHKISISLREARETNYWLRVVKQLNDLQSEELERLLTESYEIKNIIATILIKCKEEHLYS